MALFWFVQRHRHKGQEQASEFFMLQDDYDALAENHAVLESIVDGASDGLLLQEMSGQVIWANPAYCRITGFDLGDILGKKPQDFIFFDDEKPSQTEIDEWSYDEEQEVFSTLVTRRNRRKDGTLIWMQMSGARINAHNDRAARVMLVCRDVSEQVRQEQELKQYQADMEHLATHDDLTGLRNRSSLASFLEQALSKGKDLGILHVDLDRFKEVNDTLGHAAGDHVLCVSAEKMTRIAGPDALTSRIGGDEFLIACPGVSDLEELNLIGEKIIAELQKPIAWREGQMEVGASAGSALSLPSDRDAETLIQRADFALYAAKNGGRGQVCGFDDGLAAAQRRRQILSAELSNAIERGEITTHFQPILSLDTGTVHTAEALMRWMHPQHGTLTPARFFDVAEDLGLMIDLDLMAMKAALDGLQWLKRTGRPGFRVAINVSVGTLCSSDFTDRLKWEVEGRDLLPSCIIVEILETTFFDAEDRAAEKAIAALKQAGFHVALDDFGIGYAGLAHLAQLQVNTIKIDRSLVTEIEESRTQQTIVTATINLCRELGLQCTVEGTETSSQIALMRDFGATHVQGYGLARPMEIKHLINWLDEFHISDLDLDASPSRAVGSI